MNRFELGGGGIDSRTGRDSGDGLDSPGAPGRRLFDDAWNPEPGAIGKSEAARHYADHGVTDVQADRATECVVRVAGKGDSPPQHRRGAAEPLPRVVTENDDTFVTVNAFFGRKRASDERRHAEHRKESDGHAVTFEAARLAADRRRRSHQPVAGELRDGARPARHREKIENVHRSVAPVRAFTLSDFGSRNCFPNTYEGSRIRIRQWLQQHAMDDAERGGVGANRQRQCRYGSRRESWTLAERAEPVPQVPRQFLQPDE